MSRPHCLNRSACAAKTPGKHCRSCAMRAARTSDALTRWRATPEGQAVQRERGMSRLARMNTPEALAARKEVVRKQRLGWCPPERVDEYLRLARSMSAAEAKAVIVNDERVKARRAVESSLADQRARHERQIAQAY